MLLLGLATLLILAGLVICTWFFLSIGMETIEPSEDELRYHTLDTSDTSDTTKKAPSSTLSTYSLNKPAKLGLSVIIPAYNERKRIGRMLEECLSYLEDREQKGKEKPWIAGYEIIVVDDGSRDDTGGYVLEKSEEIISKIVPMGVTRWGQVKIIRLSKNRGKGGAVRHGILNCSGQYILFADADGATKFSELGKLWDRMETLLELNTRDYKGELVDSGEGIVIASRAHLVNSEAVAKRSFIRNLLMRSFHLYLHILGISTIKDTQCGFKLFTRPAAKLIFPYLHTSGWIFDVEILIIAQMRHIAVCEVGVDWVEIEGSKVDLVRDSIRMALDLGVVRMSYWLGRWSIRSIKSKSE